MASEALRTLERVVVGEAKSDMALLETLLRGISGMRTKTCENYQSFARRLSRMWPPLNIRTVISMPMIGQAWVFREHYCF